MPWWSSIVAAVIISAPGMIAAWYGRDNKRSLKTGNDKTVGAMVTEVHGKESLEETEYQQHDEIP
jgi:hypothetical protein